jgi:hypothetical protein
MIQKVKSKTGVVELYGDVKNKSVRNFQFFSLPFFDFFQYDSNLGMQGKIAEIFCTTGIWQNQLGY